jgi:hypothetical protein
MKQNELNKEIKKILKAAGIKNKISSKGSHKWIHVLSNGMTDEVRDQIKALETVKAHGDIMDDTRWYSGISFEFRYDFEATEETKQKAEEIMSQWLESFHGPSVVSENQNKNSIAYHVEKQIAEAVGIAEFHALNINVRSEMEKRK